VTTQIAPARQIAVVVADAQPLFRDALCRVVRQSAESRLVAEAGDAHETLELMRTWSPDVALVDASMPALEPRRLLGVIRSGDRVTRVLFVGVSVAGDDAYELLAQGAAGCLSRTAGVEEVRTAITTVSAGASFVGGDVQSAVVDEIRLRAQPPWPRLSEREQEILRRIAEGQSAPDIGRAMHLSVATVKTHLGHLYEKLGVGERAAAVAVAMRRGLLR
jgi:two-component system nitrate/nitrite response regulator NarL